MKKAFILLFCLFFLSYLGYPESSSAADSLQNLLKTATNQNKVDILNALSWEMRYRNTTDAFKFSEEALLLAEKLKYLKGKAESFRNLAELYIYNNNGKFALSYANEGILYATAIHDTFTLSILYNIKALVLEDQYSYPIAIGYFTKSYQLDKLQAKYDLSIRQQEKERLLMKSSLSEVTVKNQQVLIAAIIIISLLLVFSIFISFRSRTKIRKAKEALGDVSRQNQEKAFELQLANESKDKFLSIISHDLKNPICAITGLSDLLLDNTMALSEEDKHKYIKYINEGCQSADQLLENLMKWVRSQTGKMEMNPKEFDLTQPVEDAIALVNNAAIRKEITISSHIQCGTMVYADYEMVNTCLINLLSNAVKFTPSGGHITITPEISGSIVSVNVTDNGVGISPENIGKLFRLDTKSGTLGTANEKGTGLGLLLVKEFIEKNYGRISVQSKPGVGSTFTITIPKEQVKLSYQHLSIP